MRRFEFDEATLRECFGIGVAGNFAGHLEQAGEDRDFKAVAGAAGAPKGIFPFYARGCGTFLDAFPLAADELWIPVDGRPDVQIEPELGLLCEVSHDDEAVTALSPLAITAFNDCSVRRPDADKISEKKNWGPSSKGVAADGFAVTEIDRDGALRTFRLACFLRRGGDVHAYGVDSAIPEYSYFGGQLLDWTVDRLNHQHGAAGTPLEDVGALYGDCGSPRLMLIGVGATRYTQFGETHFLRPGDDSIVVLYDSSQHSPAAVEDAVREGTERHLTDASVLSQRVRVK